MWHVIAKNTGNIVGVTYTRLAAEIIQRAYGKRGRAVVLVKFTQTDRTAEVAAVEAEGESS